MTELVATAEDYTADDVQVAREIAAELGDDTARVISARLDAIAIGLMVIARCLERMERTERD